MTMRANALPVHLSIDSVSSDTIEASRPGDTFDDRAGPLPAMFTSEPGHRSTEPDAPSYSAWQFGDLTLTRHVFRFGHDWSELAPGWQGQGRGCVVLLTVDGKPSPAIIACQRASIALAALERSTFDLGARVEVLTLFVPAETWAGEVPEATLSVRHLDSEAGLGALLAGFVTQLANEAGQIDDDQMMPLAVATRMLVAACTTPLSGCAAPGLASQGSGIVERARLIVQQHMASPDFGPPQLARLLAMSRSKLYRLLDAHGGVAHFVNRERLMQAWRDLTAPSEAHYVHAIAIKVGFRDHSTFSRAFRREFGCSPSDVRKRGLTGQSGYATGVPGNGELLGTGSEPRNREPRREIGINCSAMEL
jgi:AraC-like DNA-binding protein